MVNVHRYTHILPVLRFQPGIGTKVRPNRRTMEPEIVCVRHVEAKHLFLVFLVLLARLVAVKRDTDRPDRVP